MDTEGLRRTAALYFLNLSLISVIPQLRLIDSPKLFRRTNATSPRGFSDVIKLVNLGGKPFVFFLVLLGACKPASVQTSNSRKHVTVTSLLMVAF